MCNTRCARTPRSNGTINHAFLLTEAATDVSLCQCIAHNDEIAKLLVGIEISREEENHVQFQLIFVRGVILFSFVSNILTSTEGFTHLLSTLSSLG